MLSTFRAESLTLPLSTEPEDGTVVRRMYLSRP